MFNRSTERFFSSFHSILRSTLLAWLVSSSMRRCMALRRSINARCSRKSWAVISFTIPTHSSVPHITVSCQGRQMRLICLSKLLWSCQQCVGRGAQRDPVSSNRNGRFKRLLTVVLVTRESLLNDVYV